MGKALFEASPEARQTFESAGSILGFDLAQVCFNGPEDRLNQTDISQPAIYVTGIASYRAAVASGSINPSDITALAGLSLGEYTALHLADVFDFETGLKLVAQRGKFMQEAAVASPSSMVAIMGADEAAVNAVCEAAAQGDVLAPANFNAPGQIVVSGSAAACERALRAAEIAGLKAVPLKVAGAFHSRFMQTAADRMACELQSARLSPPGRTVYSNVTAKPHTDVESIRKLLVEQIVSPVRWEQTMMLILRGGVEVQDIRLLELAPGRTLAGLTKRINRRQTVETLGG